MAGSRQSMAARGRVHRVGVGIEGDIDGDVAAPEGVVHAGEEHVDAHRGPFAGAHGRDHRCRDR